MIISPSNYHGNKDKWDILIIYHCVIRVTQGSPHALDMRMPMSFNVALFSSYTSQVDKEVHEACFSQLKIQYQFYGFQLCFISSQLEAIKGESGKPAKFNSMSQSWCSASSIECVMFHY